jgi:hypothetical protein
MSRDRWAWLFPVTYVLHITEEYFGGFPRWLAAVSGARLSDRDFLAINATALIVMTVAVTVRDVVRWPLVALATIVTVNAILHLGGSIVTASYSPGVITATTLWLPLGLFALRTLRAQVATTTFVAGMTAGVAAHGLISWLALTV